MKIDCLEKARNEVALVAMLTFFAAALRYRPLYDPLWGDEAVSYKNHGMAPVKDLLFHYLDPNQHTLFSIFSNFCMRVFGENEFWFRFPAFFCSVASLPLFYLLGTRILGAKLPSLIASGLLLFSTAHLAYSCIGRGYTLTFFLVLVLMLSVINLAQKPQTPGNGITLVIAGFLLILTLPTNAFLLAGAAGYGLLLKWQTDRHAVGGMFHKLSSILIPFAILLVLVIAYFAVIYPGLASGVKNVSPHVTKGFASLLETASLLISPLPQWCYAFFIVGVLDMRSKKMLFPFLAVFAIPLLLTFATGLIGFARVYIYWLPFVLLAVAQGVAAAIAQIEKHDSRAGYAFLTAVAIGISSVAVLLAPKPSESKEPTLADAKLAVSYIQKNMTHNDLVLVASGDYILNRFLEERVKTDMFGFVDGGKPERIYFLRHKDLLPGDHIFDGYFPGSQLQLPGELFIPVARVGNLQIYELDLKTLRFIPQVHEGDYETQLGLQGANIIATEDPKVLGAKSLVVKREDKRVLQYVSPIIKSVDIREAESYLLLTYIRKYGQKSKLFLGESGRDIASQMAYLNKYLGSFGVDQSGFQWQMVFVLFPVGNGRHDFQEVLQIEDDVSYFDAIQSFLLVRRAGQGNR